MREGWTKYKWNDVLSIINGRNQKQVESEDGEFPIYGSGGIMGYATDYLCPEECVIIGRKGNINKPIFVKEKFWNVDTAFGLNANKDLLLSRYLFYFCVDYNFERLNKAVTIPSLTKADLLKIDIPLPPLSEQESIVRELDKINEIISLKKSQLKDLDLLAQSIFYEMFGDPIENPMEWEVKKLGEVCEVTSSKRIHADEYVEDGIPFYRSKEIIEKSKGVPLSVELFISTDRYYEIISTSGKPQIGDILITAVGTIGKIWAVDTDEPFYFKDGNLIWLKDIKSLLVNSTFYRFLLFYLIDFFKKENANGAAYAALTIVKLKTMRCPLPPLSLQQTFASRIEAIEAQKAAIKQSLADAETLLNSRMDYYFN